MSVLRNNYVMSPKLKHLVFATTISDKGLIRPEIKSLVPPRSCLVILRSFRDIQGL